MPASASSAASAERDHRHAHLRERVGAVAREPARVRRQRRRQREHVRVVGLAQVRQAGARDHERAARVDLLHQVEALHLEVAHRGEVDRAGVVHHEVDAAEPLDGLRRRPPRPRPRRGCRRRSAAPRRRRPRSPRRRCRSCPGSFGCGSAVFAISATFAPSRAARAAIARPIPRLPPDMNMTLSVSEPWPRPWRPDAGSSGRTSSANWSRKRRWSSPGAWRTSSSKPRSA